MTEPRQRAGRTRGGVVLLVDGKPYTNSAAKFWPRLADDVRKKHPPCTAVELTALLEHPFQPEHLYPQRALQKELERLIGKNVLEELAKTIAALEMFGPPSRVHVRLLAGEEELAHDLELDCLDAEVFPWLAAWLLEWARIPAASWNNEFVRGRVKMEAMPAGRKYGFDFDLRNEPLSEGLVRCTLTLRPSIAAS